MTRNRRRPTAFRERVDADRLMFAARLRAGRAVLGWSQTELGRVAGLTQRAVYRLEKAATRPRQATQQRIEKALKDAGIEFENLPNGGFSMVIANRALTKRGRRGSQK
jgi:transcriptional regulator with XRE-family HTH domain